MTTGPEHGCRCDPAWPSLVVHTEAGGVAMQPAASPGALACLYHAYCTGCGAAYPGPFRAQPAARGRAGKLPGPRKTREPRTQRSGTPLSPAPQPTGFPRCMKTAPAEMSIRQLRANLADVINAAGTRDQVTFVTSNGRRVGAVVPVAIAEQARKPGPRPTRTVQQVTGSSPRLALTAPCSQAHVTDGDGGAGTRRDIRRSGVGRGRPARRTS